MRRTSDSRVASDSQLPSMRLDLFLKLSRLIPRRTLAQEACDHGGIKVNGVTAKSSRPVRAGDLIQWRHRHKLVAVKVAQIPRIRPGKADAATLYEAVRTEDVE